LGLVFQIFLLVFTKYPGITALKEPVLPLLFFSLDLFFFCFIWGSAVFIENLGRFDSGQILEMHVVLLYFPF